MNDDTALFRQVNQSWIQQGRVTSQAFQPTAKDSNRLSVYDGDQISARSAWEHYTRKLGYESVGVLAVLVQECTNSGLDTKPDPDHFPEHVKIIFDEMTKREIKKAAKNLNLAAKSRGWQYQVDS